MLKNKEEVWGWSSVEQFLPSMDSVLESSSQGCKNLNKICKTFTNAMHLSAVLEFEGNLHA